MKSKKTDHSSDIPGRRTSRAVRTGLLLSAVLIAAAAGLLLAARHLPGFAEYYASHVFPLWQNTLGRFFGCFPFSAGELLCVILPVSWGIDAFRHRRRLRMTGIHILLTVSLLFFLYSANCGVNYYRNAFVQTIRTDDSVEISEALLTDFCEYTVSQIQRSSAQWTLTASSSSPDSSQTSASGSASGGYGGYSYPSGSDLTSGAIDAMRRLGETVPSLSGYYPHAKPLISSRLFSRMGVTGIYCPFTIEANYNDDMTAYNKPFTVCHELSHLKGYMNEGEANYIGWLACIGSDDPSFTRSGWLMAWVYAGNTLHRVNPEKYQELRAALPGDALAELAENTEYWETHEDKSSEIQDQVNDTYLKSNGQTEGVQSYGRLTTWMLYWYAEENPGVPEKKP